MEPAAAKHLRLCAIPHQFDLPIFRLLMPEAEPAQAEQRYQEFSRLSLVVHRTDGLGLHDQVRRFLFDQWLHKNDPEFQTVNARLVTHFERIADQKLFYDSAYARREKMFHMIGHEQSKGIEEFVDVFHDAQLSGRLSECEALLALVREYDPILTEPHVGIALYYEARLWFERREWSHAEKLFRSVLDISGLPTSYRIKSWNRIGLLLAKQRQWTEAIPNLERAVKLAKDSNDLQRLCFAVHDLGTVYRDSGEPDRGRQLLQESIEVAEKVQDIWCIAAGYNSLGTLERRAGNIRRGIEQYKKSLEYLMTLQDDFRAAQVYNNLGAAYADLSEWEASREMYQKSLELKTDAGDTIGLARTLSNIIPVYQHLSRLQDAISAAETATHLFEELRDHFSAAVATRNLAKLYRGTDAKEEAKRYYLSAIELFREAKDCDQADATQKELDAYTHPVRMPWWVWAATVVVILAFVACIVFLVWQILKT